MCSLSQWPRGHAAVRRLREIFAEIDISSFSNLRLTSIFAPFPASQVPEGLSASLARVMHLVDAATRMQLAATGQVAACVPFEYKKKQKMTLYKGEAALAARRAVASTLDSSLIRKLQKPRAVTDKEDWTPMQKLYDAGIRCNPVTGTAVYNIDECKPALRSALWHADASIADTVNNKKMDQTDEALDELQMRLHEHAAQITEQKRGRRRLLRRSLTRDSTTLCA